MSPSFRTQIYVTISGVQNYKDLQLIRRRNAWSLLRHSCRCRNASLPQDNCQINDSSQNLLSEEITVSGMGGSGHYCTAGICTLEITGQART